ncbi:MAG: DUF2628 domain-containing protein [Pseudomonadota bacterium]
MATYTAYLPPEEWIGDPAEGFRLIRDSKNPWALIAPPIWLVWNRLWLPLLVYVVVAFAIILLAIWQPSGIITYLSAIPGLYLLLEGGELIRGKYERAGWRYAGVVEGDTREAAEIRFLMNVGSGLLAPRPVRHSDSIAMRPTSRVPATNPGLFPE